MKVGILAGGLGSRLAEETVIRPKPMVEIGGRPILWHIMMHYSTLRPQGVRGRARLQGRGHQALHGRLLLARGRPARIAQDRPRGAARQRRNGDHGSEDWLVDLIDTGQQTNTGGRIKRLAPHLGNGTFMLTWGDGVSNLNLTGAPEVPPPSRTHRHRDRRASPGAVRAAGARWRARGALRREAALRRSMDQRRLLRSRAAGVRLHRRRCHPVRARAPGAPGARRRADGLPARRLLAVHGHHARQSPSRIAVGERRCTLEDLE